jgi:glycosyltransferase involved in cell wall biosynthesis
MVESVRVSYILSTKNRAQHLERALANVREFITPADELIVMDGGSTDATAQVVEAYRDVVSVFRSEPDRGEAHGFNKAALMARGRLLKPLTDDDHIYPAGLHSAIAALEADATLDAVIGGGEHCYAGADAQVGTPVHYYHLAPGETLTLETLVRVGCGLGFVLRREMLARVGLFNPDFLLTDIDYLVRMLRTGCKVKYIDAKVFRHVSHEHSLYERGPLNRDRDWIRVGLRTGSWPHLANVYSLEALGLALGIPADSPHAPLVRAVRDLAWIHTRLGFFGRAFLGAIQGMRGAIQWLGRRFKRPTTAPPAGPEEPSWDGNLR